MWWNIGGGTVANFAVAPVASLPLLRVPVTLFFALGFRGSLILVSCFVANTSLLHP